MSFDLNIGGKALGARFAGLGMATVVAFAVAGAPGVAVAEGETGTAGSELQTVDQSVNTEVAGDDSSSVKEPSASEVANDSSTVIETQSDQDLQTPSASSGETSLPSGVTTSQEHTAGSAEVTERTKSDNAVVQAPSITGNTSAETQPQAEAQTEPVAEAPSNDVEKTSSESVGAGVSVKESGTQTAEKANTQLNTQLATKEPPKSSMQPAAQSNAKTRASSGTQTAAKPAAKTSENGKSAAAKELSAKATPAKAQASQKATPKQAQQLQASEGSDAIQDPENVYRVYNPWSGEHLYTSSLSEATHLFGIGWQWEDAAYQASASRGQQVFRLYNRYTGAHFYTGSQGEYDHLGSIGWSKEGKVWYAFGDTALFRLYNPYSAIGEHLYTTSADERATAMRAGWLDEGVAWNVTPGFRAIAGRWVVSSSYGTQERYWVSSDTRLARNRYVSPDEGTGYDVAAYATGSGAVVRNKTRVGNGVMLADNDGRLTTLPTQGWWNTSSIDGSPQWYYIGTIGTDSTGRAIVGAVTGWLTKDGTHCYALADQGYLARSRTLTIDDKVYVFDSNGAPDKYGYQNRAGFYRVSSNSVWLGHAGDPFNYVTPSRIGPQATRDDCVNAFVQRAREYLGTPYVWDYAREPGVGVDCVGLVMQCAYATGMDLGDINPYNHYYTGPNGWHSHDANNLWNSGRAMHVSLDARRPGDVISWPGHVAIYLGNDQIIEAYSPRTGVRQTSMWADGTPRGVIRLFQ